MRLLLGLGMESVASLATSSTETSSESDPIEVAIGYLQSAAAAVGGWLERAPKALLSGTGYAVTVVAAVALVVVGAATVRWIATRRALRHRVSYAVLPTDTFDPSAEEILRVASHLSRTRRAVFGSFVRRATALRVRLDASADGRMLYSIEGPSRAASLLRSLAYDEVEIRQLDSPGEAPGEISAEVGTRPTMDGVDDDALDDIDEEADPTEEPDDLVGQALRELGGVG